uniref:Uncharacterized protein n=1 Tax=Sphaerodactylus townsendi TaxID=933632 RepID=A0ACB8FZF1_9SAUR
MLPKNVSSDGAEARRRLRECDGLVDALLHALQSAVGKKDTDNKSVENCVCIMRNLSYHVHKEVPGADKFQDLEANQLGSLGGTQKKKKDDAGCFGGKKTKEEWFNQVSFLMTDKHHYDEFGLIWANFPICLLRKGLRGTKKYRQVMPIPLQRYMYEIPLYKSPRALEDKAQQRMYSPNW